ncbi:uncharacterized protein [Argopecten irradians]|uniref:uncharacterized protein n=1 Tax=Argopecten irradians TaxID=31199 RepID=UPI0037227D6A
MPRLTDSQRHEVRRMLAGGLPRREIARRMGCSPSTIVRLHRRYVQTGSLNDRPRPGRQRVTSDRQGRYTRVSHLRDRFQTARTTIGINGRQNSVSTVGQRLRNAGLKACRPFRGNILTQHRRQNRLTWTRRHRHWLMRLWRRILFTHESRFHLRYRDGRIRVWRRRGERYIDSCVRECDR